MDAIDAFLDAERTCLLVDTPMPQMRVSVVVPTLNRDQPLCETIRYFLEKESYPALEIIVIDQSDRHDKETVTFFEQRRDRVQYVQVSYKSLPRARNHGVSLATGDVVLFVDDDVIPDPGFVDAHVSAYVDSRVVGTTGPVRPLDPRQLVSRSTLGEHEAVSLETQRTMRFDVDFPFPAQWACGCNSAFRRTSILTAGGYDENFYGVSVGEDSEFSHRVKQLGHIQYVPAASLVHLQVPSGGCRNARQEREYVEQLGFCTNYFWSRIGVSRIQRWAQVWRMLRRRILNRNILTKPDRWALCVAFARGVNSATRLVRRNYAD